MSSLKILGSRPLVPLAVSLAVGIACARMQNLHALKAPLAASALLTALGLVLALGAKSTTRFHRPLAAVCLCLAAASLGSFLWVRAEKKAVPPPSLSAFLDGTERRYRVLLQPFPEVYPEKTVFPVILLGVSEETASTRSPATFSDHDSQRSASERLDSYRPLFPGTPSIGVQVSTRTLVSSWKAGDVVDMPLVLRPLTNFENPGRYDYVAEQARRGIFARASTKSDILWVRALDSEAASSVATALWGRVDALRNHLRSLLARNLSGPEGAVAQALFLGYRGAVPRSLQDPFQKAGVLHLLAISGLHVGLAAWAAFRLMQFCLRLVWPRVLLSIPDVPLAWWAGCVSAAGYALLAGFAVPTQRALIMLATAAVALALYRRPDPLSLLSLAAVLILWADPNHLFRPSFQLSFAAVAGLGLLYPSWHDRAQKIPALLPKKVKPVVRLFLDAFLVSLAATLAVAPLTAYHFYGISLAGLAANTIIVPFLALAVLPPGLAALGIAALLPSSASLAFVPIGWALKALLWLIDTFAALPYAFARVGPIPLSAVITGYAVLILWAFSIPFLKKLFGATALAAAWILFAFVGPWALKAPQAHPFQVTVLDVGQGSATLVRCPPNAAMLVDGGGFYDDSFDLGRFVVAPALWSLGIRKLDVVVLSHDHPDHRNGLRYVLENFPVGRYVETGLSAQGLTGSILTASAARRRIPVTHTLMQDDRDLDGIMDLGSLGSCRLRALHPSRSFVQKVWNAKDLNEVSLVLAVICDEAAVLLPGDIGSRAEQLLVDRWNFAPYQWLLVAPHHGSATSTTEGLLNALAPQAVFISCGFLNPFGFPSSSVMQRLQEKGLPVLRTDLHGALHAIWNGSRWILTSTLARRPLLHQPHRSP
ncbi:MAG: DNA internalization-related competence protein ComEC/Rec2 [Desulfosoma sp.]